MEKTKLLITLLITLAACCITVALGAQAASPQKAIITYQNGTLQRAEKMTEAEKSQLAEAQQKVAEAQIALQKVQAQIATQHAMVESHWMGMEYSTWYEFDGDWILQRFQSYQLPIGQLTYQLTDHIELNNQTIELNNQTPKSQLPLGR
jgi:hypothetical protein